MKERPVLFSGAMVRSLLDDTKTQTRRVVKPQPDSRPGMECTRLIFKTRKGMPLLDEALEATEPVIYRSLCPHGVPGDQLWVKETFYAWGRWETRYSAKKGRDEWHFVDMTMECGKAYVYAADGPPHDFRKGNQRGGITPTWWKRPAIFMPRAASRITLEVTAVRVERLNEISEADAQAEGTVLWALYEYERSGHFAALCVDQFQDLWESINGPGSWDADPWVWVVEFRRLP